MNWIEQQLRAEIAKINYSWSNQEQIIANLEHTAHEQQKKITQLEQAQSVQLLALTQGLVTYLEKVIDRKSNQSAIVVPFTKKELLSYLTPLTNLLTK